MNRIIQIIPSSGLWIHSVVVRGDPPPATIAEFNPIVALALAEVHVGWKPDVVVSEALVPIDSSGLMVGLLERFPNDAGGCVRGEGRPTKPATSKARTRAGLKRATRCISDIRARIPATA